VIVTINLGRKDAMKNQMTMLGEKSFGNTEIGDGRTEEQRPIARGGTTQAGNLVLQPLPIGGPLFFGLRSITEEKACPRDRGRRRRIDL